MLTHISLVGLPVTDQQATLDFFVDKLGFEKRAEAPYGPGVRWIEVGIPGSPTSITLDKTDDPIDRSKPPLSLACADVALAAKRLSAAGVEVTEPQTAPWGTYILVTEPDGRQLCVTQNG